MKMLFNFLILCLCFIYSCTPNDSNNIDLLEGSKLFQKKDINILVLRGNHFTRGYQHGYLAGSKIRKSFQDIIIEYMFKKNKQSYKKAESLLADHFVFDKKFKAEAKGMIAGMKDRNISLFFNDLGRDISYNDFLLMTSIEELYSVVNGKFGCSSISSWGQSTMGDSLLEGELIITRHWDYPHIEGMINNVMLIVHLPEETDEVPWINLSWAGMIGTCSGMNQNQVGAFLDYGDYLHEEIKNISKHKFKFRAISLSLRNSMETFDYNNDGACSPKDVVHAIQEYTPYFGSLVHVVTSVNSVAELDHNPIVVESNNIHGVAIRNHLHNNYIKGDNLALTNHYRVLEKPTKCHRYAKIVDSLNSSSKMTCSRSWNLLAGAGASHDCIYSLSFIPASGSIRLAVTSMSELIPAYERKSTYFTMEELLGEY